MTGIKDMRVKEGTTFFEAFYCCYFLIFDTGKTTKANQMQNDQLRMTENMRTNNNTTQPPIRQYLKI